MKNKKGKKNKPQKTPKTFDEPLDLKNAPHTFVIHRGLSCGYLVSLSRDFRKIMEPFTAINLQEKKTNKIKDFVSLSGIFHVSHMCIFTRSAKSLSMKISRMPQGPTLSFRVHSFILAKDVLSSLKKQFVEESSFQHAPLVILNNFTDEGNHTKLMAQTFQNMFPPLNITTIKLSSIKRCVLFSYNPATKLVEMRHFAITVVPTGVNRAIKKIAMKKIPDMNKFEDISDFVLKSQMLSESEFEDEESNVTLSQALKKGNVEAGQSGIRLRELGPRITFELYKIEADLMTGEVLYHNEIIKSVDEVLKMRKRRADKKILKDKRKKVQDENKSKKDKLKDEHKMKTGNKQFTVTESDRKLLKDAEDAIDDIPEDDTEYYKEEIGEEPEKELFENAIKSGGRKRPHIPKFKTKSFKKPRTEPKDNNPGSRKDRGKIGSKGNNFKNRRGSNKRK
ncbi:unnamed protein product [Chironomus riparius]|uniref:Brix domain-containing protein n=1 Tax=Chironomus riparius TaxID=315576 RepID=A0A9N9RXA7_9DIPT|nr:unnamed protein product [Chironomus riparius]